MLPRKPEFTSNVELCNNIKRVFEKVSDGSSSAFRYVRNLDGKLCFESYQKGTLFVPYSWAVIIGSTRSPLKGTNDVQYNLRAEEPFCFEGKMSYKALLPNFMLLYADFIESKVHYGINDYLLYYIYMKCISKWYSLRDHTIDSFFVVYPSATNWQGYLDSLLAFLLNFAHISLLFGEPRNACRRGFLSTFARDGRRLIERGRRKERRWFFNVSDQ